MPTIFLFQSAPAAIEQFVWPAVLLVIGALATAFGAWIFNRRKTNTEIHKSEMDTALSILDRLPAFLRRLEESHSKSLADESTIEKLRHELEKCIDGRATCDELKVNLLRFLEDAEAIIKDFSECRDLLIDLRKLRYQLER